MTDRERDAPRRSPDEDTDEHAPVAPDEAEADDGEVLADDGEALADDGEYEDDEEELAASDIGAGADEETREPNAATAAGAASRLRLGQRLGRGRATAATAALVTPSDRAVRISDRASQVYVVGVVATFIGILLFAMLWGAGGFFTTPHASPSPSPNAAASPSASATPSGSLQPSAASPSGPETSSPPPGSSPAGS